MILDLNLKVKLLDRSSADIVINKLKDRVYNQESFNLGKKFFIEDLEYVVEIGGSFSSDATINLVCQELLEVPTLTQPSSNYKEVSYDNTWEAVKDFEEGVKFYTKKNQFEYKELSSVEEVITYIHRLYQKTEWYKNLPESGVLCWVGNNLKNVEDKLLASVVTKYNDIALHRFTDLCINTSWKYAQPLTKEEVGVYLKNVPEEV